MIFIDNILLLFLWNDYYCGFDYQRENQLTKLLLCNVWPLDYWYYANIDFMRCYIRCEKYFWYTLSAAMIVFAIICPLRKIIYAIICPLRRTNLASYLVTNSCPAKNRHASGSPAFANREWIETYRRHEYKWNQRRQGLVHTLQY